MKMLNEEVVSRINKNRMFKKIWFAKYVILVNVLTLSACMTVPDDYSRPSSESEIIIHEKPADSSPMSAKVIKKPPRQKYSDEANPAVINLLSTARELKNRGDYPSSAAKLERALRIDPKSVSSYTLLAEVRLLQGQRQAAEQLARKAMSILAQRKQSYSKDRQMEQLRFIIAEAQSRL